MTRAFLFFAFVLTKCVTSNPLAAATLDCSKLMSCESCAGQHQGFLTCNWCVSSNSCVNNGICEEKDTIDVAYDCPRSPHNGFEYNETFGRIHVLPLCAASYESDPQKCLENANSAVEITKNVALKCDDFGDTCAAFTGVHHGEKAVVLVRGSTSDVQVIKEILETFDKNKAFEGGGNVQEYFYSAFDLLWNAGIFSELVSLKQKYPDYGLWVTGHSLGAAVASVMAEAAVVKNLWKPEEVRMLTLGQPRTGDITYAQNHDIKVPNSYRVIHAHDIVAHIPPKNLGDDGLFHHRFEVWYNNDMRLGSDYTVCTRPDDDSCSNSELDLWIPDHHEYYNYQLGECCRSTGCPPR